MNQVTMHSPIRLSHASGAKHDRESFPPGYMGYVEPVDRFRRRLDEDRSIAQNPFNLLRLLIVVMMLCLVLALALVVVGEPLLALAPAFLLAATGLSSAHPQVMEALAMPLVERK